jgi:hypothetical protein
VPDNVLDRPVSVTLFAHGRFAEYYFSLRKVDACQQFHSSTQPTGLIRHGKQMVKAVRVSRDAWAQLLVTSVCVAPALAEMEVVVVVGEARTKARKMVRDKAVVQKRKALFERAAKSARRICAGGWTWGGPRPPFAR